MYVILFLWSDVCDFEAMPCLASINTLWSDVCDCFVQYFCGLKLAEGGESGKAPSPGCVVWVGGWVGSAFLCCFLFFFFLHSFWVGSCVKVTLCGRSRSPETCCPAEHCPRCQAMRTEPVRPSSPFRNYGESPGKANYPSATLTKSSATGKTSWISE